MPTPKSKKDLERFLGMIQYIGRFIPSLSDITAPLRILLQNDTRLIQNGIGKNNKKMPIKSSRI